MFCSVFWTLHGPAVLHAERAGHAAGVAVVGEQRVGDHHRPLRVHRAEGAAAWVARVVVRDAAPLDLHQRVAPAVAVVPCLPKLHAPLPAAAPRMINTGGGGGVVLKRLEQYVKHVFMYNRKRRLHCFIYLFVWLIEKQAPTPPSIVFMFNILVQRVHA